MTPISDRRRPLMGPKLQAQWKKAQQLKKYQQNESTCCHLLCEWSKMKSWKWNMFFCFENLLSKEEDIYIYIYHEHSDRSIETICKWQLWQNDHFENIFDLNGSLNNFFKPCIFSHINWTFCFFKPLARRHKA
jgi:hypothetical protein